MAEVVLSGLYLNANNQTTLKRSTVGLFVRLKPVLCVLSSHFSFIPTPLPVIILNIQTPYFTFSKIRVAEYLSKIY